MSEMLDLLGTTNPYFQIQIGGPRLTYVDAQHVAAKFADDSDYAGLIAGGLNITQRGGEIFFNVYATLTGSDWQYNLAQPFAGQTANVNLILPPDEGEDGYVLTTDGTGETSWAPSGGGGGSGGLQVDTTTLVYTDSSPKAMFTLPANAVIDKVQVVIDASWNDPSETLSVGFSPGSATVYCPTSAVDLTATPGEVFEFHPGQPADVLGEALQITYTVGGSPTAGAARVLVYFSIPT